MSIVHPRSTPQVGTDWDGPTWDAMQPALIGNYMGEKPAHFPRAEVKVAYDDSALYVMFCVEDRYVRAVADNYQGNVCTDSCVEFFFTPGQDIAKGYFNIEMNCGGTTLFHFQESGRQGRVAVPEGEFKEITVAHSMPEIVEPEIEDAVTWIVSYRLPVSVLGLYTDVEKPVPGRTWLGNFYKCGDKTSHPHWLTWAPVDYPTPNFHLPKHFGVLEFV